MLALFFRLLWTTKSNWSDQKLPANFYCYSIYLFQFFYSYFTFFNTVHRDGYNIIIELANIVHNFYHIDNAQTSFFILSFSLWMRMTRLKSKKFIDNWVRNFVLHIHNSKFANYYTGGVVAVWLTHHGQTSNLFYF